MWCHKEGKNPKQDCLVSDHSDTIKVVLWEDNWGQLNRDRRYRLHNFRVREYACKKYLSMLEHATIENIDDIGEVVNTDGDEQIYKGTKKKKKRHQLLSAGLCRFNKRFSTPTYVDCWSPKAYTHPHSKVQ